MILAFFILMVLASGKEKQETGKIKQYQIGFLYRESGNFHDSNKLYLNNFFYEKCCNDHCRLYS